MIPFEITNFADEIINPSIDLGIDYGEIGLDKIITDPVLQEIPIVKTLVSVARTGFAIRDRFFVKKFLIFLREFHNGKINEKKLNIFKDKFDKDMDYREKVTEQIIILNESFSSIMKSKILAQIFKAYIEDAYDWNRFSQLSDSLQKLHEAGYRFLKEMAECESPFSYHRENIEGEALMFSAGIGYRYGTIFRITSLGQDLYKYGIDRI